MKQGKWNIHGESLVEIHVANIAAAGSWVSQSNLGVEVGTVEVNLASVVVNDLASLSRIYASATFFTTFHERTHILDARLKDTES